MHWRDLLSTTGVVWIGWVGDVKDVCYQVVCRVGYPWLCCCGCLCGVCDPGEIVGGSVVSGGSHEPPGVCIVGWEVGV